MLAVTERLSVGLADVLAPSGSGDRSVGDVLCDASGHASSQWFPSARTAIRYALLDAGVEDGDEVLIPAYTCYAVESAVDSVATPVCVDVDERFTIDTDELERSVSDRTEAVVPVHLYGMTYDAEGVSDLADEYGLTVIEDAAQAVSNLVLSDRVGTHSDYTVLSFRFYKEMTVYRGGILLGNVSEARPIGTPSFHRWKLAIVWLLDTSLRRLPGPAYHRLREGLLEPLSRDASSTVGGAEPRSPGSWTERVLSEQLADLASRADWRRSNAAVYRKLLPDRFELPDFRPEDTVFRYPVLVPTSLRDRLYRALARRGIGVSKMYSYTISEAGDCEWSDELSRRILLLPVHAGLGREDVERIVGETERALSDVR